MQKNDVRHIPLLDNTGKVCGLLMWKDFFENGDIAINEKPNQVVIMAGGKGTRLDLFTKILPKPLIPVGEKPIIGHIMDNFSKYGFNRFLISLNYKADMIKIYFSDNHHDYGIDYVQEENFLGTAGALALARDRLYDTFMVSNCDVIIDTNLDRLFGYHKENGNHATILSTVRNIKIPYGVLRSDKANLQEIVEKPEYNFVINSGIYVLEPEIIDLIPDNQAMDMPDLLISGKEKGLKVQIYPMTCSWFDVGEWGEYKRAVEHMTELGTGGRMESRNVA
jgi:NDP-sugar pyrophosphorylase family protein